MTKSNSKIPQPLQDPLSEAAFLALEDETHASGFYLMAHTAAEGSPADGPRLRVTTSEQKSPGFFGYKLETNLALAKIRQRS
jgi:hypothetical protein